MAAPRDTRGQQAIDWTLLLLWLVFGLILVFA